MDTNPYEPPTAPPRQASVDSAPPRRDQASPTFWTTLIGAVAGGTLCNLAAVTRLGPRSVLWDLGRRPGAYPTPLSVLVLVIGGSLIGLFLGLRMERGRQGKVE